MVALGLSFLLQRLQRSPAYLRDGDDTQVDFCQEYLAFLDP